MISQPARHCLATVSFITAVLAILIAPSTALAVDLTFRWGQVDDPRLVGYELHYGEASGQYQVWVDSAQTQQTVTGLEAGKTYYFAVKAISSNRADDSPFCPEVKVTVPDSGMLPDADFTASTTTGVAPMVVVFNQASTGEPSSFDWDFGDSGNSTGASAVWTYTRPGTYSVSLTATGAGGSDRVTKTNLITVRSASPNTVADPIDRVDDVRQDQDFPMEVGEVVVADDWQWVEFGRRFENPVVVANPPSFNDSDPAVVRISGVEPTGFWVRIQEWDHQDGIHAFETLHYIVMEQGTHRLPNGQQVEAGTLIQSGRDFSRLGFVAPFEQAPVVLASVSSENDPNAVTTRIRQVTRQGFQLRMDEQESNAAGHGAETISYIAWPVSQGTLDALTYRVGRTGAKVTHRPFALNFGKGLSQPPAFLAQLQSMNADDPAALRYRDLTNTKTVVWVEEEQSHDQEATHAAEAVGWMIFSQ